MATDQASSYDEIPYSDYCFPYTHADYLAIVGKIFGVGTPPVDGCRVLELGCAAAGNLVPMALEIPGACFVGVDLSRRQIEAGQELVRQLGLSNVDLRAMSLTAVDATFGKFDYIICHGVYSWVPEAVRDKILEICSANLAPGGIAYVSYNTYPGWHARGMVREMLAFHVRHVNSALERVQKAREFLEEMVPVLVDTSSAYARILRTEGEFLRGVANSYLYHEHLEETNHPMYFSEFIGRAAAHGLRFVAEARTPGLIGLLSPESRELLDRWSDDEVSREQYADFLCNRTFRRTLLCHADAVPVQNSSADLLDSLWLSSALQSVVPNPDVGSDAVVEFRNPDGAGSLSTGSPLLKAALVVLRDAGPKGLPFNRLWERVRSRLDENGTARSEQNDERRSLREALLRCFLSNFVDLHAQAPAFTTEVRELPAASHLARIQAEESGRVTNLRRRTVELGEFERLVLRSLDGTRDRSGVLERLLRSVEADEFTLYEGDEPVRDIPRIASMFTEELGPCLERLARLALLAG